MQSDAVEFLKELGSLRMKRRVRRFACAASHALQSRLRLCLRSSFSKNFGTFALSHD
jgi:hypothetical protein